MATFRQRAARLLGLLPFLLLSPFIAVVLALMALFEFPRLLLAVCLLLAASLAAMEADTGAGLRPGASVWEAGAGKQAAAWLLTGHLRDMEVFVEREGGRIPLAFDGLTFRSRKLPPWNWVGLLPADFPLPKKAGEGDWDWAQGTQPGRVEDVCLWVHPVDRGALVIRLERVPRARRMTGWVHFLRSAARDGGVVLSLRRGTEVLARFTADASPGNAVPVEWELAAGIPEGRLEIAVDAVRRGRNHACLALRVEE